MTALFREGGLGWGNFRMCFSLRDPHLGVGHRGEFHVKLFSSRVKFLGKSFAGDKSLGKKFWNGFRSARFVGRDGFLRTVSVFGKNFWMFFGLTDLGGANFCRPAVGTMRIWGTDKRCRP